MYLIFKRLPCEKHVPNFLKSLPVKFSVLIIVFIRFYLILNGKRGHDSKYTCKKKNLEAGGGKLD